MVNRGFSEAIGSCRIMAMRLPRTCRISSVGLVQKVLALEHHAAAGDARPPPARAAGCEGERALARARFAHDAQGLAGVQAERDLVDGTHHARPLLGDIVRGQFSSDRRGEGMAYN